MFHSDVHQAHSHHEAMNKWSCRIENVICMCWKYANGMVCHPGCWNLNHLLLHPCATLPSSCQQHVTQKTHVFSTVNWVLTTPPISRPKNGQLAKPRVKLVLNSLMPIPLGGIDDQLQNSARLFTMFHLSLPQGSRGSITNHWGKDFFFEVKPKRKSHDFEGMKVCKNITTDAGFDRH